MIDTIDSKILTILQDDARTSNADIARQLGMAPSAIFERIRKLESRGVIEGYTARVNPRALARGLLAFIYVRADERLGAPETSARLAVLPEVQEVHHIAGEDCFLVKVRVADTEALSRFLRECLGAIDTISSTRTTIVLSTVKETAALPLRPPADQESTNADHDDV
ncbi:MAG: Lrp/AsnC family transcriptional regulator [Ktedonobacterales bacterium]